MAEADTPTPSVLVVDDDAELARLVADYLASNGMRTSVVSRGDDAVTRILAERPDAVVLDLMLPGCDGVTVCRRVRPAYEGVVLMLTARGDEVDEVVGLEVGADDYMTKPVRPRVLLARLHALLRRAAPATPTGLRRVGRLVVDGTSRSVRLDGGAIDLTTSEFDLLWVLVERAGQVIERDELYTLVRGIAWDGLDRSIDLRVSRLRRKLGDGDKPHRLLKSVRGTGYLLAVDA